MIVARALGLHEWLRKQIFKYCRRKRVLASEITDHNRACIGEIVDEVLRKIRIPAAYIHQSCFQNEREHTHGAIKPLQR